MAHEPRASIGTRSGQAESLEMGIFSANAFSLAFYNVRAGNTRSCHPAFRIPTKTGKRIIRVKSKEGQTPFLKIFNKGV